MPLAEPPPPVRPSDRPQPTPSLTPHRVTHSLPRPIHAVIDPLQPLPSRPKKSAIGAWLMAVSLVLLAAAVLWLNLRPRRASPQLGKGGTRDRAEAPQTSGQGDNGATDPAVRKVEAAEPGAKPIGDRPKPRAKVDSEIKPKSPSH